MELVLINTDERSNLLNAAGQLPTGQIYKFARQPIARVETNANGDELSLENIQEIAATHSLKPIDMVHKRRTICGVFINPVVTDDTLYTDGLVWGEHYPDVVADIRSGRLGLSVGARAKLAVCSTCGGEYHRESDYCSHLQTRGLDGTHRKFKQMWSCGGGFTPEPAGSDMMVSPDSVSLVATLEGDQDTEGAMMKVGDMPLDTPGECRKAADTLKNNKSDYTPEQYAALMDKIQNAMKKLGMMSTNDSQGEKNTMDEKKYLDSIEELKTQLSKAITTQQEAQKKFTDSEAALETMKSDITSMVPKAEVEATLEAAKIAITARYGTMMTRVVEMAASMGMEKATENKEVLADMGEDAYNLLKATAVVVKDAPAKKDGNPAVKGPAIAEAKDGVKLDAEKILKFATWADMAAATQD